MARRVWVAAAMVVAGCQRPQRACNDAWDRGAWQDAVKACGQANDAGKLAWGYFKTGNAAEARKLLEKPPTGPLLLTKAALAWRRGQAGAAELEAARSACQQERDSACAARASIELNAFHYDRGDYRAALADVGAALAEPGLARDVNLRAQAQLRLFDFFYELGDAESAGRALAEVRDPTDPLIRAGLKIKEANLRSLEGRTALAASANLAAAEEATKANMPAIAWSARLNLVKAAARDQRPADARKQLAEAEALLPKMPGGGNPVLALALHRALTLHAESRLPEALKEADGGLAKKPVDEWQWELQLERALIARDQGDRRVVEEACNAAIDAAERIRAAMGFDELKTWLFENRRKPFGVLFDLYAQQGDVKAALATAERAFSRTFLDAFAEAHTAAAPDQAGPSALARAEALKALLPALRESRVVAPAPLDQVLKAIGSRHALVYFTSADALWLIDVRSGVLKLHKLDKALDADVGLFLRDPGQVQLAESLGSRLIPGQTDATGELYIVAPGPLTGLPFAALRAKGRLLAEVASIHYVPSLTALAAIASDATAGTDKPLVLGDARGDLPGARAEAASVATALGTEPLLQAAATRDALAKAATASTLHLAVHGGVGMQGAWLQLGDGDISGADVLKWRLRPRLASLTACASAATRARELWGSMGAAFLASGSHAVLASLWSVDDAATRALADRFYREGGAADPAQALARTQRALAQAGAPASSWAAFVILGE